MTSDTHDVAEPKVAVLMLALGVTKIEARILIAMIAVDVLPRETLHQILSVRGGALDTSIGAGMKRLRRKLPPGAIGNIYGVGFRLSEECKMTVRRHLQGVVERGDDTADRIADLRRRGFGEQAIAAKLRIPYRRAMGALA